MSEKESPAPAAIPAHSDPTLSLAHLQAELARLDVLMRREVRRWRLAGQDPADAFRGLYVSDQQAEALLSRPLATSCGEGISLCADEEQAFARLEVACCRQIEAILEEARARGQVLPLERLRSAFGLERFEVEALLVCLAPALDLRYERLYGYLQDDVTRKRPSVNLILDLLCPPGPQRLLTLSRFGDDAPLLRHQLLERIPEPPPGGASLLGQSLRVDDTVVAYLLGRYQPRPELAAHAALQPPEARPEDPTLAGEAWQALEPITSREPIVLFDGPDAAAQQAAARLLAARLGRPLLSVDIAAAIAAGESTPLSATRLALRDARLLGALPLLTGWDSCLNTPTLPALLKEVCSFPATVVIAGQTPWQFGGVERDRLVVQIAFPVPDYARRHALWLRFLGHEGEALRTEVDAVAGRFLLTGGQIRDAVATARDLAAQRGSQVAGADLFAAARAHSNPGLATLARKIVPRYGWSDIVLPPDQVALLREIIATVRERSWVLEEWGVGKKLASSPGITILFAGPPGTGKTMAAEIMAAELGLDLYKIELSAVVSKYIGETEKNLERIFAEAATSNAILFFDEADALFGKRSEVRDSHDRYANIEISYLLQRMEAYEGVTILATNLRANLDQAFTRRLQFAVDFPFPEEADRLRIWQTLFPPDVPRAADVDLAFLARRHKLAGGSIRNIIVAAAYLAAADGGPVTMADLLHSTRRELQKMGRLVEEEPTH